MPIDNISGVAWSSVSGVSGKNASDIASLSDIAAPVVGGADITFNDITTTSTFALINSSTPIPINLPSTAATGDWVLVIYGIDNGASGSMTVTPSGWTSIVTFGSSVSDTRIWMWYRELDGTEGSTLDIYGPTALNNTRSVVSWSMVVDNIDTSSPVSVVSGDATLQNGSLIIAQPATAASDGTFIAVVSFDGDDGDPFTFSNPSFTLTNGGELDNPAGALGLGAAWKYATIASGQSTDYTTITSSASNGLQAGHVVFKKA